jgi:hypothetical protein
MVKNGLKSSQFLADFLRIRPILFGGFWWIFTSDLAELKKIIWQRCGGRACERASMQQQ